FAIQARRSGPMDRLRKWLRRHPGLAAGIGLATMAIFLASVFALQSWGERRARIEERKQLAESLVFSGQFPEAEKAIAEAEALGAAKEWVLWRRGLIAFHCGEQEKAFEMLKPAVARMPENVAATCLMVTCAPNREEYENVAFHLDS